MPRFYFNYHENKEYTPDDSGVVFDDFESAYADAFDAARAMWHELMAERKDPRACAFEITDADDRLLAVPPFREVLDDCMHRRPLATRQTDAAITTIVETAHRTRHTLDEFNRELDRARTGLDTLSALLRSRIEISDRSPSERA